VQKYTMVPSVVCCTYHYYIYTLCYIVLLFSKAAELFLGFAVSCFRVDSGAKKIFIANTMGTIKYLAFPTKC